MSPTEPLDPTLLLVWDAPNIDMGLGAILGERPTSSHRPRFDALGRWLLNKARTLSDQQQEHIEAEATVFTNVSPANADAIRPWVEALRNLGFAVFAKPKTGEHSDVDDDMLNHIRLRHRQGILTGVVIASADGQNFQQLLEDLSETGVETTVIGFQEHASWAVTHPTITFVDFEDVPGVFREPLPRVNLDNLPVEGAWLQPFRPLSTLLPTEG